MRTPLLTLVILSLSIPATRADVGVIFVPGTLSGPLYLQPNMPGQVIEVRVIDPDPERAFHLDFRMDVNYGDPFGPIITAVDLVGPGTIFNPDNLFGQVNVGNALPARNIDFEVFAATASGPLINGVLGRITLDTTGAPPGVYALRLGDIYLEDENFLALDTEIVNGVLAVVPEPDSWQFLVAGCIALVVVGRPIRRRPSSPALISSVYEQSTT